MKNVLLAILSLSFFTTGSARAESALGAAKTIVGTYTGAWEMYGYNASGELKHVAAWTDILTAKNAVQRDGKAFVTVSDIMKFANGKEFPKNFTEGYLVNPDGSAGSRYYNFAGQIVMESKIGADTWAFETVPDASELTMLGFDPASVTYSKHITVKAVTVEKGKDTEWISRTTTVQWTDSYGTIQVNQFTSMKGHHTRVE